jgi:hypothetical protein
MELMKIKLRNSATALAEVSGEYLVPTPEIDLFWHTHQLALKAYAR